MHSKTNMADNMAGMSIHEKTGTFHKVFVEIHVNKEKISIQHKFLTSTFPNGVAGSVMFLDC